MQPSKIGLRANVSMSVTYEPGVLVRKDKIFPAQPTQSRFGNSNDKRKEYLQAYRIRNNDRRMEYGLEYYSRFKGSINETKRQFRIRNNSEVKASDRLYRLSIKDKRTDYLRQYRAGNLDRLTETCRRYYFRNHANLDDYLPRTRPLKSWQTPEAVQLHFDSLACDLHISQPHHWYRVSRNQINDLRGQYLYRKFDNLGNALRFAYPKINWDVSLFSVKRKKASQRWLKILLEELLPGVETVEEYRHPELSWGSFLSLFS